jgi:Ca2+-transporting ATPase
VVRTGTVMAAVTLLTIDVFLPAGLIEGTHDLATARTAGFTVLVFAQLFNCLNARSETTSAFRRSFVNPWLWSAIALSVMLQVAVVHVGFLNLAFGTRPLTFDQWLTCAAMASLVLWSSELRKLFSRASNRRDAAAASV